MMLLAAILATPASFLPAGAGNLGATSSAGSALYALVITFCQFLGVLAGFRSLLVLWEAGDLRARRGLLPKAGMLFAVGGLLLHLPRFVQAIHNTFPVAFPHL